MVILAKLMSFQFVRLFCLVAAPPQTEMCSVVLVLVLPLLMIELVASRIGEEDLIRTMIVRCRESRGMFPLNTGWFAPFWAFFLPLIIALVIGCDKLKL